MNQGSFPKWQPFMDQFPKNSHFLYVIGCFWLPLAVSRGVYSISPVKATMVRCIDIMSVCVEEDFNHFYHWLVTFVSLIYQVEMHIVHMTEFVSTLELVEDTPSYYKDLDDHSSELSILSVERLVKIFISFEVMEYQPLTKFKCLLK